mmetsp:Transcript_13717/g.16908  ORF Transcript_13717/g.16908 Transcript_13717/m.16908 type:complete len:172 (+) Transcript_13717:2-517(+)
MCIDFNANNNDNKTETQTILKQDIQQKKIIENEIKKKKLKPKKRLKKPKLKPPKIPNNNNTNNTSNIATNIITKINGKVRRDNIISNDKTCDIDRIIEINGIKLSWEWKSDDGTWNPYCKTTSIYLENALQNGKELYKYDIGNIFFFIDIKNMIQYNNVKQKWNIRRNTKI